MKIAGSNNIHSAYDRLPLSYHSLNEKGEILHVNKKWLEKLGYDREEVIGRNIKEFVDEDLLVELKKTFEKFLKEDEISEVQLIFLKKDGNKVYASLSGNVEHVDGQVRTHCVFEDVSKIRETQKELQKQNKDYLQLYEKYQSQIEEQQGINEQLRRTNDIIKENELRLQL